VSWDQLFIAHDPAWNDVTVRELLDHTSGMPKAQNSWLNQPGSCAIPLGAAIAGPPTATRGTWTYSNGNYCALGLLIESIAEESRDRVADDLVFRPIGVTGPHLTTDGLRSTDGPYAQGVGRLERLGGAGTWLASTDDVAEMLDSVTPADLDTLRAPGIITDQYGWGHTGTIDGAKACAWVMEGGRTVVVAIIAGSKPATGGKVCDAVVPAIAADLGIWAGKPIRIPD
jgi:CubicO group peptidase (beta-lactamase class C family)